MTVLLTLFVLAGDERCRDVYTACMAPAEHEWLACIDPLLAQRRVCDQRRSAAHLTCRAERRVCECALQMPLAPCLTGPAATTVIDYCLEIPVVWVFAVSTRPLVLAPMQLFYRECRSGFPAECLTLDVDDDGDVDLEDAAGLFRDPCYAESVPLEPTRP